MLQGIRGAITVAENKKETIFLAVQELLMELVEKNNLKLEDIGAAIFSATPDLNAAFPAAAARKIGWDFVPLFGTQELDVENGLDQCVRVLLLVNTEKKQKEIVHVYLGDSNCLRPDLAKKLL
ncbi:chorismate mutase [Anaerosinus massiliensis]|uniref:chorismate mutase n=1 Tax=Massilibacillus massiliensis TaxID=1806837 RepID=UPI000A98B72A|nr:chorismate mutase [Massilibacillus massiliensis]